MKNRFFFISILAGFFLLPVAVASASMSASGASNADSAESDEPVNLSNGNLFVPATDIRIPGRGTGLELTRTYNSQVTSHLHTGWDVGLGTWVIENGEVSGEGGQIWHPKTWGDFDLSIRLKTIAQDPEGTQPDLEFYTGWIHFRFKDYNNHYQLILKTTGVLELVKYYEENGRVERQFWRQQTALSPFQWNKFRVKMEGGRIIVWVNGEVLFDFIDPTPLPEGRIGLESHRCHTHWDDMSLANLTTGSSHSHDFNEPNQEGMFGYAWSSNLEMQIMEDMPINGMTMLVREDGKQEHFMREADGTYTSPLGIHDQLTKNASGYTLRRKDGLVWSFDSMGMLMAVTDRNDNAITLTRDAQGRVNKVTDPIGRNLSFVYGANGKVAAMTDPAGRQWNYLYDASNHLVQVTDPLGLIQRYEYDPVTHNMTRYTDKAGAVFQYAYTIDDRIKTQTDPEGKLTTFTWQVPYAGLGGTAITLVTNALGETWSYRFKLEDEVRPDVHDQIHVITDPYGNTEGFAWDVDKNRIGKTDESNRSVFWEYDARGNPTRIIQFAPPAGSGNSSVSALEYEPVFSQLTALYDPNEHETHYEYDARGNLTKLWRPFNYVDKVENAQTYDAAGQLLTSTDPLGRRSSFTYDANGNRTSATDPLGNTTTAAYDAVGRPVSVTDADGRATLLTWDAGDRLVKVTDAAGGETVYTYNGNGDPLTVTNPEGEQTSFEYDGVGNLTRVTDPLGNAISYAWDTADFMRSGTSRLIRMTDANGKVTTYDYDRRGRLIQVTDPLNHLTRYGYDATTHVTSITDANGKTTTYAYDDMERLTRVTNPLGYETSFTYDRLGHIKTKTDAEGQTTTYSYDELDRLTRILSLRPASGGEAISLLDITYSYDKAGNRIRMADSTGITTYAYDDLNRLTSVRPELVEGQNSAIAYSYDKSGNRTGMTSPIGSTLYAYDALNRLSRLTDPQGGAYDVSYDKASRRTSLRFPNGVQTGYQYDRASRLTQLNYRTSASALLAQLDYLYDPSGNVLSVARSPAGSSVAGTSTYAYDALNQLTRAAYTDGVTESFTYDPAGNRQTANGVAYAYDAANRLLKAGSVTYAYDKAGNQTARHDPAAGSFTYSYDGANRLLTVDAASIVTRRLNPGWNFISHPFLGTPLDVKNALASLNAGTDYDQLARYNPAAAAFQQFVGVDRYDQFAMMEPGRGYELYETNPNGSTLNLPSSPAARPQTVPLSQGWNLIGSPRAQSLPVNDALSPLVQGTDYDQVKQFNSTTQQYEPATTLQPGTAYWLRTLRPAQLTIPPVTQHAISYAYDGDGNRVSKTVQGVTTRFLYDGLDILAEFNQTGTLTTSYVHGPGIDQLLSIRDNATGKTVYPLTDHLGSTIALVDANQQVQATFSYAAFGATRTKTGASNSRFTYTGRELDPESGLLHYRARAYDTGTGRFLQQDPLSRTPSDPRVMGAAYYARLSAVNHPLPGGGFLSIELPEIKSELQVGLLSTPIALNSYVYVMNNPLRFTDPMGENPLFLTVVFVPVVEVVLVTAAILTTAYAIYQANNTRWGSDSPFGGREFPHGWNVPGKNTGKLPPQPYGLMKPPSNPGPWMKGAAWGGIAALVARILNALPKTTPDTNRQAKCH